MNIAQIIVIIKLLLDNKESILELFKLIQSLFTMENLIGDAPEATVYNDAASYPVLAGAVAQAGYDWSGFIKLLVDNLDELKLLVSSIMEIIDLFKKP